MIVVTLTKIQRQITSVSVVSDCCVTDLHKRDKGEGKVTSVDYALDGRTVIVRSLIVSVSDVSCPSQIDCCIYGYELELSN